MTKKNMLVGLLSFSMLVAGSAIILRKKNQQAPGDLLPVELHSLKMADGWGYEVLVDRKVFIHQDCIPAIASYKKFNTESDALLIGNKVVEKIKHGQKPSITEKEITGSHINY